MSELVVANGSTIKVKAVEPENGDVQFVGAYVTRQTKNGLEKKFIPAEEWTRDGSTYTYVHPVEEPADIVLVFIKPPTVVYDANGGQNMFILRVRRSDGYRLLCYGADRIYLARGACACGLVMHDVAVSGLAAGAQRNASAR